ncbi:hypothetical protein CIB48_g10160 [Xylaria polymorpha]|nr:hypothetical protein CIB48_g10160 [Xylaria polymorpha]
MAPRHNDNNQTFEWAGILVSGGELKVNCAICKSRLSLHEPPDNKEVEAFTILPCGHAFGYDCIKAWFQMGHPAKCPSCGASAKHSACGHLAKLRKMQQENKSLTLEMVDRDGLPPSCDDCHNLGNSLNVNEGLSEACRVASGSDRAKLLRVHLGFTSS